jgi:ankyrin repeat protein
MNKKFIIGLFPVIMAFALPSLFLGEKSATSKGAVNTLSQLVSQKLASTSKRLTRESNASVEDINAVVEDVEHDNDDEQDVSKEMLEQALSDHGLKPALVYAFHRKNEKFLAEISPLGALELEKMRDRYDSGILHWAVMGKCLDCVKAALKKGLNVNAENTRGETPLVFAINDGDFEMAHYLISVGADPNVTPNNVGFTLLMSASFEGLSDLAGLIIKANGNILAADEEGKTAIHYAAKEGHSETVSLLIKAVKERGLNLSTVLAKRDTKGKSALDYASDYGHEKVKHSLIRHRL